MARTTTEGGTTSGYSLIGSTNMAIPPARKITIESTLAKIARSMKNLEKCIARASAPAGDGRRIGRRGRRVGVHRGQRRGDLHSRPHPLETVHHDLLAGLHALLHDAEPVHQPADLHRAVLHRAVGLE